MSTLKAFLPSALGIVTLVGGAGVASAQTTTMDQAAVQGMVDQMISEITSMFTGIFPSVIPFVVGFAVFSLFIAYILRRFKA